MDGVLCNLDAALGREMHDRNTGAFEDLFFNIAGPSMSYGVLPIAPSQRIRYSITTEVALPTLEVVQFISFWYSSLDESYRDYVLEILYSRGFFESIPPVPGAIQGVMLLASVPNVIVTSTYLLDSRHCASEKKKRVDDHLGTDPRDL
ncbi:hypothetical protein FOZ60_004347 [Perkinsus olseni]|uniref:Uncharacterized protein n=1 Tax=Perkinsus olseni TaxID=32597 RepID=A0A7J6NU15_PEROL|nr:hypothetical protein FOZ60_004347 [Perkinsus olseni]